MITGRSIISMFVVDLGGSLVCVERTSRNLYYVEVAWTKPIGIRRIRKVPQREVRKYLRELAIIDIGDYDRGSRYGTATAGRWPVYALHQYGR